MDEALPRNRFVIRVGVVLVIAASVMIGSIEAGDANAKEAAKEMEFGFKAARRGYWQEALMRFEHANELTPGQPRILNNIAVAQEANGFYEMALLSYQEGLAIDANNNALRRNYARFQEFYASYIAAPEGVEDEGAEDAPTDN